MMGVRFPPEEEIFSFPSHPDWLWGPLTILSNGFQDLLHQKWPENESDHYSPLSSTKVKNA
jgi:hypothetical protein